VAKDRPDECAECGSVLPDDSTGRAPCPTCGSTRRIKFASGSATARARFSAALTVVRAWDAGSLTLAGVIYGIVVTVVGVIVAPHGTWPTVIYAVVALVLLAAGLLVFAQPIIRVMRWILDRAIR
jgi:hypothetical protein